MKRLRWPSIRVTLLSGLGLVIAVMSLLTIWGQNTAFEMERLVRSLSREQLAVAETLTATNAALRAWTYSLLNSLLQEHLVREPESGNETGTQVALQQIDALSRIDSLPPETQQLLDEVRGALGETARLHDEVIRLSGTGNRADAAALYRDRLRPELDRIEAAMAEFRRVRQTLLRDAVGAAERQVAQASRRMYPLAGTAIFCTALVVYLLSRRITQGVTEVVHAATAVAREVLHQELPTPIEADEITCLKDHIAGMRLALETGLAEQAASQEHLHHLENQLAHAARVSTLGEMASGIAHELNQPLTAIAGYTQACLERTKGAVACPEDLRGILQKTADQTQRAGAIIQCMRSFVRKQPEPRTPLRIDAVVREALVLLDHEIRRHRVRIELALAEIPLRVWANRIELEQVIINLVRNALVAMSATPEPVLTIRILRRGNDVEVSILDRGVGLAPAVCENLFRPFFTTKPDGIGLGLAISRTIVEAHGGRLWAGASPDGGAVFSLALPVYGARHADAG